MTGTIVVFLLLASFSIRMTWLTLYFLNLWQRKEYRWDRVVSFLKTNQGKSMVLNPFGLTNWIMVLLFPVFMAISLPVTYFFIVSGIFIIEASFCSLSLLRAGWKLPVFGLRTVVVTVLALFFFFFLLFFLPFTLPFVLLILDRIVGLLFCLLFLLSKIPFSVHEKILITKARHRLSRVKPIIVGITGSYGKTSTKEFLYQILSPYMSVVKTPKSQNSLIGVAETIVSSVIPGTDVALLEMGAYQEGEIAAICALAKPKIAILTGINEQHIELFGSIDRIMKAKFELIDGLPPGGKAIINGDNSYCLMIANWAKKNKKGVILYSIENSRVKMNKKGIQFFLKLSKSERKISIPVLGKHQAQNILAAIQAARALGLSEGKIVKTLVDLQNPAHTMQLVPTDFESVWVDDTYNSNITAVKSVLSYMRLFSGQRILVFQPLIELGHESERIHSELGREVGEVCTMIVLTNGNYFQSFRRGFNESKNKESILTRFDEGNLQDIIDLVRSDNDVIVFEGRESFKILTRLLRML